MKIIEKYVAPWALRGEDIPIHLRWEPEKKYSLIRVILPDGFILKDLMNVRECNAQKQEILINRLAKDGYFGLAISNDHLFDTQIFQDTVQIEFISDEKTIHIERIPVRIFRPFIRILESTETVVLTDDVVDNKCVPIKIKLKYTGFGDAFVGIRVKVGGTWRHTGEIFYHHLLKLLMEMDEHADSENKKFTTELIQEGKLARTMDKMGHEVVYERETIIEDLKRYLERCIYKKDDVLEDFSDIDMEEAGILLHSLKEKLSERDFADRFYSNLGTVLIEVLLNSLKRTPSDNVYLKDSDNTALIEKSVNSISVEVSYKDALGNDYDPLPISIAINDKRTKKIGISIPIEVNVTSEVIDAIRGEDNGNRTSKCGIGL